MWTLLQNNSLSNTCPGGWRGTSSASLLRSLLSRASMAWVSLFILVLKLLCSASVTEYSPGRREADSTARSSDTATTLSARQPQTAACGPLGYGGLHFFWKQPPVTNSINRQTAGRPHAFGHSGSSAHKWEVTGFSVESVQTQNSRKMGATFPFFLGKRGLIIRQYGKCTSSEELFTLACFNFCQ